MLNGKVMMINLTVRLIKMILLYKMSYCPEPYTPSKKKKIKVELYLFNYGTKSDLKSTTGLDLSDFAKNTCLTSLNRMLINKILLN